MLQCSDSNTACDNIIYSLLVQFGGKRAIRENILINLLDFYLDNYFKNTFPFLR